MKRTLLALCILALPAVNAAENSFHFTLQQGASLNGNQLKPGDYRIQVDGDKATVKVGKTVIEVPVKAQNADRKFKDTLVGMEGTNGNHRIIEIDIGGSTTRLVFSGGASAQ